MISTILRLLALALLIPLSAPCCANTRGVTSLFPYSATLTYQEDNYGVPGTLQWQRDDNGYKLTLSISLTFNTIQYQSSGQIDRRFGLRPQLFQEVRNGKIRRSARFDWDNHVLHIGSDGQEQITLQDGAQDMLSLSWQLALKGGQLAGDTQLTNGRKVYQYPIRPSQAEIFHSESGRMRTQVVQTHYDDMVVEVWLAPNFSNIPVRIMFSKPGEPAIDLQIIGITLNGVEQWGRPNKPLQTRNK